MDRFLYYAKCFGQGNAMVRFIHLLVRKKGGKCDWLYLHENFKTLPCEQNLPESHGYHVILVFFSKDNKPYDTKVFQVFLFWMRAHHINDTDLLCV